MRFSFAMKSWRISLLIAGFLSLAIAYYIWTWSYELGDFGGDNAFYLLTALHFSPWSPADEVATYFASQSQYPPLYPLVLALFGGGESLLAAHVVTTTILLLAFVAFYHWIRRAGISPLIGVLAVLLFALLPGTYIQALSVLSENLYLLFVLSSMIAIEAFEKNKRPVYLWLAAIGVACALLTRSVGVALGSAFVLFLLIRRPARYWIPVFIAFVPAALWQLVGHQEGQGYVSSFLVKYSNGSLGSVFGRLWEQLIVLWHGWAANFAASFVGIVIASFLAVIGMAGAARRAYFFKVDGLYIVAYLLLIVIWPYPAEAQRFMFVAIPILLAQGLLLVADTLPRLRVDRFAIDFQLLLLVAVSLVVIPGLLLTIGRFVAPIPERIETFRRTQNWYVPNPHGALVAGWAGKLLVEHMKEVRKYVPANDCVYGIKPSILGFYARRISVIPPPVHFTDIEFAQYLDQTRCRFFYAFGYDSPSFPVPFYPLNRLQDSITVISGAQLPGETAPFAVLARREGR